MPDTPTPDSSQPHEDVHVSLGAYVLGGLTSAERHQFESHLPDCDRCRRELAESAAIPALLSKVGTASRSVDVEPVGDVTALLDRVRERRRGRTRTWAGLAAAACVASATTTIGLALTSGNGQSEPAAHSVTIFAVSDAHTSGRLTLTAKPWGTAVAMNLHDLSSTGTFSLRVTDESGHAEQAASWGPTVAGVVSVTGATSIDLADVRTIAVVNQANTILASTSR